LFSSFCSSFHLPDYEDSYTLSVWVKLASNTEDIRTVLSNKASGCPADGAHGGYALYVNNWMSSDGKIVLEYGDSGSGCNKLESKESIPVSVLMRNDVNLRLFGVGGLWSIEEGKKVMD
jgi:hypothetical protein